MDTKIRGELDIKMGKFKNNLKKRNHCRHFNPKWWWQGKDFWNRQSFQNVDYYQIESIVRAVSRTNLYLNTLFIVFLLAFISSRDYSFCTLTH